MKIRFELDEALFPNPEDRVDWSGWASGSVPLDDNCYFYPMRDCPGLQGTLRQDGHAAPGR